MVIIIDQPNGQPTNTLQLPPHGSDTFYMESGDNTLLLYQTATAPFKIREKDANGKVYAQGRIAYYVGGAGWNKYSFLDAISYADHLKIDTYYSCNGSNKTFDNKIVIDGTPQDEMQARRFPTHIRCQGFKYSVLRDNNHYYTPFCANEDHSVFVKGKYCRKTPSNCEEATGYYNGDKLYIVEYTDDTTALQSALDRVIGNAYCNSW